MGNQLAKGQIVAKKILAECGLDDPTEMPLADVIWGRGAFYQELPLDGKEGEVVSVGNRATITVNSRLCLETRKRFAAAHELGHYEMHRKVAPLFADSEYDLVNWYQQGEQETEANDFAAEFLMPSPMFARECRGKRFGPALVEELAGRFKVSKTALLLAYVRKGNHPVCLVYCRENKMKWWKRSDDFKYFLEFERDVPPPSGSVAYELFTTRTVYSGDDQKQDILKSTWFRTSKDERGTRFYEYCLFARSFGYSISVLWED